MPAVKIKWAYWNDAKVPESFQQNRFVDRMGISYSVEPVTEEKNSGIIPSCRN